MAKSYAHINFTVDLQSQSQKQISCMDKKVPFEEEKFHKTFCLAPMWGVRFVEPVNKFPYFDHIIGRKTLEFSKAYWDRMKRIYE